MKAPVGLLSDRTVYDSRWRGFAPTNYENKKMCVEMPRSICGQVPNQTASSPSFCAKQALKIVYGV